MKNIKYDEYYLKFKQGEQTKLLRSTKDKCFNSWNELANLLSVSRSMIFLYLSEKCKLPLTMFKKMIQISNQNPHDYSFKVIPYSIYGKSEIPKKITPDLSEFVGIMLGDGHINRTNYQITISCGNIDGLYIKRYIPQLIKKLFSKDVSFRQTAKEGLECKFNSKDVCNFLSNRMDVVSPKVNCIIPPFFFENHNNLKSCVRGLFDTDGGLHKHHKNSAQLQFTNKCYSLIKSLRKALVELGHRPSRISVNHKEKGTHQLYLFGDDVIKYFNDVGSSNPKNVQKFDRWVKEGKVPLNKELCV